VARLRDRIVAHRLVDRVWRAPSKFGGRNELLADGAQPEVWALVIGRSKLTMPTQNDHIAEIFHGFGALKASPSSGVWLGCKVAVLAVSVH
jgi:hypothetical protein